MAISKRLRQYLKKNKVQFKTLKHPVAYTTQEVAAAQHVSGYQIVKTVAAKLDGKAALAVVQASRMVDFKKLKKLAKAKRAGLASEEEIQEWIPGCEVGAMSPLGELYGLPVYADNGVSEEKDILFNAESHTDTVKISWANFKRLAKPIMGDIAEA